MNMRKLLPALALLSACSSPPAAPPAPAPEAGELKFQVPAAWMKEEPANRLRKAQFRVPDKEKQTGPAELAVFHMRNAGNVDSNVKQWVSQMGGADPKREEIQGQCKVTLVDLFGTYQSPSGDDPVEHARMLAGYIETDDGPWIFKLVGPLETVGDWREEFIALLRAAR
jgi:hypothetical protein